MAIPRIKNPSVIDLSPGSLRVWVLVGVALVFVGLAALRPLIDLIGMKTRLAVAEQSLAGYRTAVLTYCAQFVTLPEDIFQPVPKNPGDSTEERETTPSEEEAAQEEEKAKTPPGPSLGQRLISSRKIDEITFPMGERNLIPPKDEEEAEAALEPNQPVIWAVSIPELSRYFHDPALFPSSRSGRAAVLVVPFLTEKEAEAIQKMLGGKQAQATPGSGAPFRVDCFFTQSSLEGRFTGWLYLADL